jgi:glycosyltransferase involved in cell wall biosynthesis
VNICGLPVGWDGCGYYRCYSPLTRLAEHGHQVSLPAQGSGKWLPDVAVHADLIDVLVGQLTSGVTGMGLWEEWHGNAKLVYDVDDDIWSCTYPPSPWVRWPELVPVGEYLMSLSDVVTVSTPRLAEIVSRFNSNVVVLPNFVHEDLLGIERPRRERVTIGWTPSPSHEYDATHVALPLRRFLQRNRDTELHIMGMDYRPVIRADNVRHSPWTVDMWDYYRGIDFDIGIAPLAANAFNRSKSALKALEYAALGVPVVASDLDPYRDFVVDGVTGFLVKHDHEWGRRLRDLVEDEPMRSEMGVKAREHARAFTIQEHWPEWERVYAV